MHALLDMIIDYSTSFFDHAVVTKLSLPELDVLKQSIIDWFWCIIIIIIIFTRTHSVQSIYAYTSSLKIKYSVSTCNILNNHINKFMIRRKQHTYVTKNRLLITSNKHLATDGITKVPYSQRKLQHTLNFVLTYLYNIYYAAPFLEKYVPYFNAECRMPNGQGTVVHNVVRLGGHHHQLVAVVFQRIPLMILMMGKGIWLTCG